VDPPKSLFDQQFTKAGKDGCFGLQIGPAPMGVINGCEMVFEIIPSNLDANFEDGPVRVGVTRQAESKWAPFDENTCQVDPPNAAENQAFPPGDKPNDDLANDGESRDPEGKLVGGERKLLMYSIDGPGYATDAEPDIDCMAARENFLEYIQISCNYTYPNSNSPAPNWSRASDKFEWHCCWAVKTDAQSGKFVRDNRGARAGPVQKKQGFVGGGSLNVTSLDDDKTMSEKWMIEKKAGNAWRVCTFDECNVATHWHPDAQTGVPYTCESRGVSFTITSGTPAFEDGDEFFFWTRRECDNEVEKGHKPLGQTP